MTADLREALVQAVLSNRWGGEREGHAHGEHAPNGKGFYAFCEVCSGNVGAIVDALLPAVTSFLAAKRLELTSVPVPTEGHVLWLVTLPDEALEEDAVDDLLMHLHQQAEAAAPGRSTVVALGAGASLQVLSDEQLAAIGLRRAEA